MKSDGAGVFNDEPMRDNPEVREKGASRRIRD
jgi:hypothetical protein